MGTDLGSILENPIGQPMATILFNSLGTKGALTIFSCIVIVQFTMGTSIVRLLLLHSFNSLHTDVCSLAYSQILASSRQTFAFARDGALPFSKYIYSINKYTGTPVNAVWFAAAVGWLLGWIAWGGSVAITPIFALGVGGQYIAYMIPIASRFIFKNDFKPGPFNLGKFVRLLFSRCLDMDDELFFRVCQWLS